MNLAAGRERNRAMERVLIHVEGQTEEAFVHLVLVAHLSELDKDWCRFFTSEPGLIRIGSQLLQIIALPVMLDQPLMEDILAFLDLFTGHRGNILFTKDRSFQQNPC